MDNTKKIPLMGVLNAGEEKRRLLNILRRQPVRFEHLDMFKAIINEYNDVPLAMCSSLFSYGLMEGIRQERAKKRKTPSAPTEGATTNIPPTV